MSLYKDASLVMIPSAYKDGKLYSIRPTDGSGDFTFSRGSNLAATRVDVNGLIEKGRENLLLQSNAFSTSPWNIGAATLTSGQTGYDGSSNAWLLSATSSFANVNQNVSLSNLLTFSVYAKAGTGDWMVMRLNGTLNNLIYVDLTNQVFGSAGGVAKTITDMGNGWSRVSVTINQASYTAAHIYVGAGDGSISTTNETIYIQDAQLEAGLVATDYIETGASTAQAGILEDMPRLDYSGGASCPALLLEPQRTNKLIHSEYFGAGTGWGDNGLVTRDFGYLAPDGTYSATKITNTGSGGASGYVFYGGVLPDDSRSVYARTTSGTGTANLMTYFGNTNNVFTITEEWQRFDLSSVTTTTGQGSFYLVDFRDGDLNEIILWGAQCEEASYPTSYIPTYGSSVTRSQDLTTADTSSFYTDSSNGTLFSELSFPLAADGNYNGWFFWNGSGYHRIVLQRRGDTGKGQVEVRINNTTQASIISSSAITLEDNHKMLVRWDNNEFTFFIDGVNIGSDTSTDSYSGTDLNELASRPTYNAANIKQAVLFPTALTDSECIALTTL